MNRVANPQKAKGDRGEREVAAILSGDLVLAYKGDTVTARVSRHWHRRFLWAYFPPYRWWRNSRLYHRWIMRRFRRANQRLQRQIGEKLIPSLERATKAMIELNETFRETA